MTHEEAMAIAQAFMDSNFAAWNLVVFYAEDMGPAYLCDHQPKKYIETKDPADAQGPGLGPICVPKDGSEAWMLLSAFPFADQIAKKYGTT